MANKMATKSETAEIAVLQTQMITVIDGIKRIDKKLDDQANTYVTRGEFTEFKKRWGYSHIIVGVLTALMTALIFYFFTGGKHL